MQNKDILKTLTDSILTYFQYHSDSISKDEINSLVDNSFSDVLNALEVEYSNDDLAAAKEITQNLVSISNNYDSDGESDKMSLSEFKTIVNEYEKAVNGSGDNQQVPSAAVEQQPQPTEIQSNAQNFVASIESQKTTTVSNPEYTMFDASDLSHYSSNLKEFASEVIKQYDEDNDGKLNINEFTKFRSMGEFNNPQEITDSTYKSYYEDAFKFMNFDEEGDQDNISVEELASQFFVADLDEQGYNQDSTKTVANHIDGKFNYQDFVWDMPIQNDTYYQNKHAFFNSFYANNK